MSIAIADDEIECNQIKNRRISSMDLMHICAARPPYCAHSSCETPRIFLSAQHAKRLAKNLLGGGGETARGRRSAHPLDKASCHTARRRASVLALVPHMQKEQIFRSREQRRDKTARCLQSPAKRLLFGLTMQLTARSPRRPPRAVNRVTVKSDFDWDPRKRKPAFRCNFR